MGVPFESLVSAPYPWLGGALAAAILTGPTQGALAKRHLSSPAVTHPIVDWELARTKVRLDEILDAWDPRARRVAGATLGIDIVFLGAYGFGLALASSLGAALFADFGWQPVGRVFEGIAWGALVAAGADVVENVLLASTLVRRPGSDFLPRAVYRLAKLKFLLSLKVVLPAGLVAIAFDLLGSP
ncbi:MAG TPA: hypothetical protein VG318_08885 [Actinomycetota bacterium]|nr:hypothetical protein [Actinomycetota bacterium]